DRGVIDVLGEGGPGGLFDDDDVILHGLHAVDFLGVDGGEFFLREVVGRAGQRGVALVDGDFGGRSADVAFDEEAAADFQGHPSVGLFWIRRFYHDVVLDAGDAGEIFDRVGGEIAIVAIIDGAGERDDAVAGFYLHVVFKNGAVVVGGFGGVLDLAIIGGGGEQRERADEEGEQE